jgi:hypothetical protein
MSFVTNCHNNLLCIFWVLRFYKHCKVRKLGLTDCNLPKDTNDKMAQNQDCLTDCDIESVLMFHHSKPAFMFEFASWVSFILYTVVILLSQKTMIADSDFWPVRVKCKIFSVVFLRSGFVSSLKDGKQ